MVIRRIENIYILKIIMIHNCKNTIREQTLYNISNILVPYWIPAGLFSIFLGNNIFYILYITLYNLKSQNQFIVSAILALKINILAEKILKLSFTPSMHSKEDVNFSQVFNAKYVFENYFE